MSKVFKLDKAGRDTLLQAVAAKFAATSAWPIKESDRKENYVFLDPVMGMKAYNEGVRFCVQSSAKTVNVCLEVYSRKEDEAKQHAFAARLQEVFADKVEVAGLKMEWKVIYKGGLLRVAIPANKTDDEMVTIMSDFKAALIAEYNGFFAELAASADDTPITPVPEQAPVEEVAAPAEGAPAADQVIEDEAPAAPPVVEEEVDLA